MSDKVERRTRDDIIEEMVQSKRCDLGLEMEDQLEEYQYELEEMPDAQLATAYEDFSDTKVEVVEDDAEGFDQEEAASE